MFTRISPSSSGMPPPLQSSGNSQILSTSHGATAEENYTIPAAHLPSYPFHHGNPALLSAAAQHSMIATPRSLGPSLAAMTSANAGYGPLNSAMQLDSSSYPLTTPMVPPFDKTQSFLSIVDVKGSLVHVELHAKIDKGFFKADKDWTCYRRNYFSVACSYSLKPLYAPGSDQLFIHRTGGTSPEYVRALAICITAKVNGDDAKPIELVQHTPKRDKGPLGRPEKVKLMPSPAGSFGIYSEPAGPSPSSQLSPEYDSSYSASSPNSQQSSTMASFDRIQFKNATANNGKRRAAQQYFHIVVELFADVSNGQSSEEDWRKIASRTSAPMVVRGRSPGHYQDDRRSSSANMGPGGGSGNDHNGRPRDPSATGPSGSSRGGLPSISFSGSSRLSGNNYLSHHASSNHSPPKTRSSEYSSGTEMTLSTPAAPTLSPEEVSNIENYDGYQYYPGPIYEAEFATRPHLPPVRFGTSKPELEASPSRSETSCEFPVTSSDILHPSSRIRRPLK